MRKLLYLLLFIPTIVFAQPSQDSVQIPSSTPFTPTGYRYKGSNASNMQYQFYNTATGKWISGVTGYQFQNFIGTATATALGLKAPINNATFTGTTNGLLFRATQGGAISDAMGLINVTSPLDGNNYAAFGATRRLGAAWGWGVNTDNSYMLGNSATRDIGSTIPEDSIKFRVAISGNGRFKGTVASQHPLDATPDSLATVRTADGSIGRVVATTFAKKDSTLNPNKNLFDVENTNTARLNIGAPDSVTTYQLLRSKYATQNDLAIRRTLVIDSTMAYTAFGDSYTSGTGATTTGNRYVNIIANTLRISSITNSGQAGRSSVGAAQRAITTIPVKNSSVLSYMAGFTDIRRGGNHPKIKLGIQNSVAAFIANGFLDTAVPGNSGTITYGGGSWSTARTDSLGGKAVYLGGLGMKTTSAGATATFTVNGNNVVIGTSASDGALQLLDSFRVTIDGNVLDTTFNFNANIDTLIIQGASAPFYKYAGPSVVYLPTLGTGSHTIVITKGGNTAASLFIDYVGTLRTPSLTKPLIIGEIARMSQASIEQAMIDEGSTFTNETIDSANVNIQNAVKIFQGYPVAIAKTNQFFLPESDVESPDVVHPNNIGHLHLAEAFLSVVNEVNTTGVGTVTSVSGTANRITVVTGTSTPVIDISATFEALLGKVANPLSQFASTTSTQLRSVLSNETGNGSAYFQNGDLGTPSAGVMTNVTGVPASALLNVPVILSTTTGINAKTTGATALYTVPSGKVAVITAVIIRSTAATAITVAATADIGDSITGVASIYPSTVLTGLTSATKAWGFSTQGIISTVAATGVINLNINTAATGTSQTYAVDLIGYTK